MSRFVDFVFILLLYPVFFSPPLNKQKPYDYTLYSSPHAPLNIRIRLRCGIRLCHRLRRCIRCRIRSSLCHRLRCCIRFRFRIRIRIDFVVVFAFAFAISLCTSCIRFRCSRIRSSHSI